MFKLRNTIETTFREMNYYDQLINENDQTTQNIILSLAHLENKEIEKDFFYTIVQEISSAKND